MKRVLDGARPSSSASPSSAQANPAGWEELSASVTSNKKRAQMLVAMLELARAHGVELRDEHREPLDAVRGRRDALRNSVMDYARVLRSSGMTCDRATETIADVLRHREETSGDGVVGLIDAASRWIEQVYAAA